MLSSIIKGEYNNLIVGHENSITRKIILHRLFTWIINEHNCSDKNYSKLFKIFKCSDVWSDVLYAFYVNIFGIFNPQFTHSLIVYVWHNVFHLAITSNRRSVMYKIKYNNEIINNTYHEINGTSIFIMPNSAVLILNYILGINSKLIKFPGLASISDAINDYDRQIILKTLLLKNMNTYIDIIHMFFKFFTLVTII